MRNQRAVRIIGIIASALFIPFLYFLTELYNYKTAALFFEHEPALELQFGLHATSVKHQLDYIRQVDPRIRIVWEDCGAFPFSYIPHHVADFDQTMDFTDRIAILRGESDHVVDSALSQLIDLDGHAVLNDSLDHTEKCIQLSTAGKCRFNLLFGK